MRTTAFELPAALRLLEDLIRVTAFPASPREICHQGLSLVARALGAPTAMTLMREPDGSCSPACTVGDGPWTGMAEAAAALLESGCPSLTEPPGQGPPERLALLLPGDPEPLGVLVLSRPAPWTPEASAFASVAARTLAASFLSARKLLVSHQQGELLARRNIELETLRELVEQMQEAGTEQGMLQVALDLVLRKLGLSAGWIFWGESARGTLELAASRGIAPEFIGSAREGGVGVCLCADVFETGKLRYARNTLDCPRLPELVQGKERMAHACIPLKFERGTMGVMNIASRPGQAFSGAELQFLEIVGNQLCLAVDKLRTARAESRRNAESAALVALARAIGGSLDLDRVLEAVGGYAARLLEADRCAIFLGEPGSQLQFAHLTGAPFAGLEVGQQVDFERLGARAVLEALSGPKTLVIQNIPRDPRANAALGREWGIGSEILIPLVARDRVQGLLMAGRANPSTWSPDEAALADALAKQATVAIENARLYREAAEALDRLQRAQYTMMRAERMAAVGTLASSLAHEVRNPLNSINLQLVLLSRRVKGLEAAEKEEISGLVEAARHEIARLDALVEEFLSLSSIDRLSREESDLPEIVRETMLLMGPVARLRGISVNEQEDLDAPRMLLDREKIKQVLINLVRNAMEAMPGGGSLLVKTRFSPSAAIVSVADEGVGIEHGIDVFDFFTTTKRGGTGLGLPISRRIAEAHGGTLTYASEPGRGTTFFLTLPLQRD